MQSDNSTIKAMPSTDTAKEDLVCYSSDSSNIFGTAKKVLFPINEKEVQEAVKDAISKKIDVVPRGAGTGLCGGCVPQDSIVLDLSKMNLFEINSEKKRCKCMPGVVLDDLNFELEKHGLMFPIRPLSYTVCTIGGMVSTDAAGSEAVRFGKTSNWVASVDVVDGKGNLIKDVMPQDFAGKEGICGVIVSVNLILVDLVEKQSLDFIEFEKIEDLLEQAKLFAEKKSILILEYINKKAAVIGGFGEKHVLIATYIDNSGAVLNKKEIEEIFSKREKIAPKIAFEGYKIVEDPEIPLEKINLFMDWVEKNNVPCFGHLGIGIFHPRFMEDDLELINEMFSFVKKLKGNVSGEHGIGFLKKEYLSEDKKDELISLKRKYDPQGIFNKGKVIDFFVESQSKGGN